MKVPISAIVFVSLGILSLLVAGLFLLIYRTFEYNEHSIAKVTASLIEMKHKKMFLYMDSDFLVDRFEWSRKLKIIAKEIMNTA